MKKLLLLSIIALSSCSKEDINENACQELREQYSQNLQYVGSSSAALANINAEYKKRKKQLGCD